MEITIRFGVPMFLKIQAGKAKWKYERWQDKREYLKWCSTMYENGYTAQEVVDILSNRQVARQVAGG